MIPPTGMASKEPRAVSGGAAGECVVPRRQQAWRGEGELQPVERLWLPSALAVKAVSATVANAKAGEASAARSANEDQPDMHWIKSVGPLGQHGWLYGVP